MEQDELSGVIKTEPIFSVFQSATTVVHNSAVLK